MASSLPETFDETSAFDFTAFGVHKSVAAAPSQSPTLGASYDYVSPEDFSLEPSVALDHCDFSSAYVSNAASGSKLGELSLTSLSDPSICEIETTTQCPSSSGVCPPDYDYAACCCCGCDDGDSFALPLTATHLRLSVGALRDGDGDCSAVAASVVTSYLHEHSSSISTSGSLPSPSGSWVCSSVGEQTGVVSFAVQMYRDTSAPADCATFIVEWQRRRGSVVAFGGLFDTFHEAVGERCGGLGHVSLLPMTLSSRKPMPRGERKRAFSPPPAPSVSPDNAGSRNCSVEVLQRWAESDVEEAMSAATAMLRRTTATDSRAAAAPSLRCLLADVAIGALEAAVGEVDRADASAHSASASSEGGDELRIDVRESGVRVRNGNVLSALQSLASIAQNPAVQPRLRQSRAINALARCSRGGCSVARSLSAEVLAALSLRVTSQPPSVTSSPKASGQQHRGFNVPSSLTKDGDFVASVAAIATTGGSSESMPRTAGRSKVARAQSDQGRRISPSPVLRDSADSVVHSGNSTLARHRSSPTGKVRKSLILRGIRSGSRDSGDEVAGDDGVSPTCPHDLFHFNA